MTKKAKDKDDKLVTKDQVMKALKNVIDPELGVDIVDLGLVYGVKIAKDGNVDIDLTLTSPGCPVAPMILADAEENTAKVKGVKKVTVQFVFDPPWSPDKISDDARLLLGI